MTEAARGACLVEESRRRQLVVGEVRVDDLHGNGSSERDLLGAIDAPHPAHADQMGDSIAARERAPDKRIFLAPLGCGT
jgi:hypothetical protein